MEYLVLKYDLIVTEVFFYALLYQVDGILPVLIPGEKYELKVLCGESFWNLYTDGQKRIAGRCMVHMVETGMLPLHIAEGRHEYPKLYSLR